MNGYLKDFKIVTWSSSSVSFIINMICYIYSSAECFYLYICHCVVGSSNIKFAAIGLAIVFHVPHTWGDYLILYDDFLVAIQGAKRRN
ncbi:hypothetical protein VNO78_04738 [Psophocarpus tetragonolobus]|uniref:Uncharacterized protein n=1 Tax=Psophocarpus tetragonolobus TaxID=3891 RepID=A0AAN9XWT0_PSOTE